MWVIPVIGIVAAAPGELTLLNSEVWEVADGGNGNTYELWLETSNWNTWEEANAAANGMGGHLAALETAAENEWVFANVAMPGFQGPWNGGIGPWLGGYQVEGSAEPLGGWYWVTGEPIDYDAWFEGEPNDQAVDGENYLIYWSYWAGAQWNDYSATNFSSSYIVEYEVPAPATLTLLLGALALRRRRR